jgi:hypothetical protein
MNTGRKTKTRAGLVDRLERLGLVGERPSQMRKRRQELGCDLLDCGDMHGSREGVVRRLAHIDVIIWMNRRVGAERPPSDSFARFAITSLTFMSV